MEKAVRVMPRGTSQRQGRSETWCWLLCSRADFTPLEEGTGVQQSPAQVSSLHELRIQPCRGKGTFGRQRRVVPSSLAGSFI